MNLQQALDLLAGNCPSVFSPITKEFERLRLENVTITSNYEALKKENEKIKQDLVNAQSALDLLIVNGVM